MTPKNSSTRPTSGLLRQALFNICQGELEGAHVLDLFAGSGALGLEALSRGAASVSFVERERKAFQCLEENVESLKSRPSVHLYKAGVFELLPELSKRGQRFDLIFADPPYLQEKRGIPQALLLLNEISRLQLLKEGGLLFIEEGGALELTCETLESLPPRRYGDSYLYPFRAPR